MIQHINITSQVYKHNQGTYTSPQLQ